MTSRADKIKEMADDEWVEIEHPKSHETYGVKMSTFRAVYEAAGFEVIRMGDGSPIVADAKEPEVPADAPVVGIQGDAQPGTLGSDEPVVVPTGATDDGID